MWFHCKALVSTCEVCARINGWEHFYYVEFVLCTFFLQESFEFRWQICFYCAAYFHYTACLLGEKARDGCLCHMSDTNIWIFF